MFIEKIYIDTFGKLSGTELILGEGVNIIEGANESGKSTIASFIKFIFYGVTSKEKARMLSWRTGSAAGSITVSTNEGKFRIERAIVGRREALQLINAETGMPIKDAFDNTTPGELFFGVDADMFEATAFVSQLGGISPASRGGKLHEGIENILFSADESVNTDKALAKLDAARAALLHKNEKGGKLYDLEIACAEAESELSRAIKNNKELLEKKAQHDDSIKKLQSARKKAEELSKKAEQFEIRSLLSLFKKKHQTKNTLNEISQKLENTNDNSIYIEKLKEYKNTIAAINAEISELEEKKAAAEADIVYSDKLDEYEERGGREELKAQKSAHKTKGIVLIVLATLFLLAGLGGLALGALPIMLHKPAAEGLIALGAVLTAVSVTSYIFAAREYKLAGKITADFNFDELDAIVSNNEKAREASRFISVTLEGARERLNEIYTELSSEFNIAGEMIDGQLEIMYDGNKRREALEAEYDKEQTIFSQLNAQLRAYDEDELLQRLDESLDLSEIDASQIPEMRREADFSSKAADVLEKNCLELEKSLVALSATAIDPKEAGDKLELLKLTHQSLYKKHAAYLLAYNSLINAGEKLRASISPRLAADAAGLFSNVTDGKYSELGVGSDFEMAAQTESGNKPLDLLSAGTKDAAYLCLRMSLISLLYKKEFPPMVFDESFSRQDNTRIVRLIKLIHTHYKQSLIFTSNGREAEIMKKIGVFNHINL